MDLGWLKQFDPILVEWTDTCGSAAWAPVEDHGMTTILVSQLCYYIRHSKESLEVCGGIVKEDPEQVLAVSVIPLSCVSKVRRVRC